VNAFAEAYGVGSWGFALLALDVRGHGESGGLVTVAGSREVADVRVVRDWLAARPEVSDTAIGVWGISYGGGIALNSLVAGVPWRAVVVVETWTDLADALVPQGLLKSGLAAALLGSVPESRRDPALSALLTSALAGRPAPVLSWARERSSLERLGAVSTPVLLAQGRRDFLFGFDQGARAFQRLRGPKALYLGLHGHTPSTFPAADTALLMERTRAWFDCHLRSVLCDSARRVVHVVPETFRGQALRLTALPPTRSTTFALPGVTTIAQRGEVVRATAPLRSAIEIFGSPTVTTSVAASGGWSRLVAVLTARTPQGRELVVSTGGVPTRPGAQRVTIRLVAQATTIPRGARLTLTLASSSTAQASSNLLYLDLPMPPSARLRVGPAILRLPVLRTGKTS
ncbi:MAG: CocE/NonD family hydrolase, partial [Thermoleophilia bacterium]|nr:CocE/NonD family hydrolase [Gaiellaceae bacterium]MDW8339291.1 CocE/NonD family hydrolase [Thermoleophilia bacterium]